MVIAAIDPGPNKSALVLWDGESVIYATEGDNEQIIELLMQKITLLSAVESLAIEKIESFGMTVGAEVFETVFWSGRFAEAWMPLPSHRLGRKEIKLHLCNSVRAKDANIRQALIDRFGLCGTKKNPGKLYGIKNHCWAALAVAVTFFDKHIIGKGVMTNDR